jgi:methionine synthase II (cobalamin-independent)
VTGIGSLPGTDPVEAQRLVLGELPQLPHLVELPGRGPGAEMIGRTAALLVDLPVEIVPSGWRLASRPGRDLRRARDMLHRDLDALEAIAGTHRGPLKIQIAGPWTLAACVELASGHKVVSDGGAVRDLIDSLAEGLEAHLAAVRSRLPDASVVVQLDEPAVTSVLNGSVATPSGYGTVGAIEPSVVRDGLAQVFDVVRPGRRVIHSCAADVPVALLRSAGADAISLDLRTVSADGLDALGEAVEAGLSLWAGAIPATDASIDSASTFGRIRDLWSQLGFPAGRLATDVVATPACGLAGASASYVRTALRVLREVGERLLEAAA